MNGALRTRNNTFRIVCSVVLLCSRFGISSAQNLTVDRRVHSLLLHIYLNKYIYVYFIFLKIFCFINFEFHVYAKRFDFIFEFALIFV